MVNYVHIYIYFKLSSIHCIKRTKEGAASDNAYANCCHTTFLGWDLLVRLRGDTCPVSPALSPYKGIPNWPWVYRVYLLTPWPPSCPCLWVGTLPHDRGVVRCGACKVLLEEGHHLR